MGTDVYEAPDVVPSSHSIKVHRSMCAQLMKLVDKISKFVPKIESTRPRGSSGLQTLCLLNRALEKANLLLQHCSESSKLYLVITGNAIVSRCERARHLLDQSLTQIQNDVPVILAVEISRVVDDVRSAVFELDSSDEEVGKAVLALLHRDNSLSDVGLKSETEILQDAAIRLQINSPKALLIEKRSIKKMLDKVREDDQTKRKICVYLLHLLKKHGSSMASNQEGPANTQLREALTSAKSHDNYVSGDSVGSACRKRFGWDEAQTNMAVTSTPPPVEFKCPISMKLMFDPVIIASGQTFERTWIQKWLDDGNITCPKTKKKLDHFYLTPNAAMKDMISNWCKEHGITVPDPRVHLAPVHSWETSSSSISSFGSSMNAINLPVDMSNMSFGSFESSYVSDLSNSRVIEGFNLILSNNEGSGELPSYSSAHKTGWKLLAGLASMPWESQTSRIEDVDYYLKNSNKAFHSISSENFVEPLLRYFEDAKGLHDTNAQKSGSKLLLTFLSKQETAINLLHDEAFSRLASLLDSDMTEHVLAVMVVLSGHKSCRAKIAASGALSSVINALNSQTPTCQDLAVKVLHNIALDSEIHPQLVSLDCIPKLVRFLNHSSLANYCVAILQRLCDYEKARISIAETTGCIASIAELLESGSHVDQENALAILLALCTERIQYCKMVMDEGIVPSLCSISVNGSDRGKINATELLRTLRDISFSDPDEQPEFDLHEGIESSNRVKENPASKTSGFWGKFTKRGSTPRRKK